MRTLFGLLVMVMMLNSCAPVVVVQPKPKKAAPAAQVKKAPPGQVKKATGSQSAKPYAPGQQKKKP